MKRKRLWLCLILVGCLLFGYWSSFSNFATGSFVTDEEETVSSEIDLTEEGSGEKKL